MSEPDNRLDDVLVVIVVLFLGYSLFTGKLDVFE